MATFPAKPRLAHDILHLSFNQDCGCFAVGASNGFRVFNCEPFQETFRRDFDNGGIGIVEMLFRSNILALVGGGSFPRYPPNKVMIWDDRQARCIGELPFRSQVRRVALRKDLLAVALEHKVLVYAFADLRLESSIETAANPAGLLALSTGPDRASLACPGLHTGQVRLEAFDTRRTRFIQAHNSSLGALCLTPSGRHLATASEKGTLIRVWATADGTRLQELRRGTDGAEIYSLAFGGTGGGSRLLSAALPDWLAVTSSRGTLHIFNLHPLSAVQDNKEATRVGDPRGQGKTPSKLAAMGAYLPMANKYFASERSFAQYKLPDRAKTIVGFGREPGTLLVLSYSGTFYKLAFDPNVGGPCEKLLSGPIIETVLASSGHHSPAI